MAFSSDTHGVSGTLNMNGMCITQCCATLVLCTLSSVLTCVIVTNEQTTTPSTHSQTCGCGHLCAHSHVTHVDFVVVRAVCSRCVTGLRFLTLFIPRILSCSTFYSTLPVLDLEHTSQTAVSQTRVAWLSSPTTLSVG